MICWRTTAKFLLWKLSYITRNLTKCRIIHFNASISYCVNHLPIRTVRTRNHFWVTANKKSMFTFAYTYWCPALRRNRIKVVNYMSQENIHQGENTGPNHSIRLYNCLCFFLLLYAYYWRNYRHLLYRMSTQLLEFRVWRTEDGKRNPGYPSMEYFSMSIIFWMKEENGC